LSMGAFWSLVFQRVGRGDAAEQIHLPKAVLCHDVAWASARSSTDAARI